MDIDIIRQQFISSTKNFLAQIEKYIHGLNPDDYKHANSCVKEMEIIWAKIIMHPFDILLRMDKTSELVHTIMQYVSSIDISAIATKIGISTTAKGVLALAQYHIRENGDKIIEGLCAQADEFMAKSHIDNAQIINYVRNVISDMGTKLPLFGTIMAQAIAFCSRTLTKDEASELHLLLVGVAIDKLMDVSRTPIDNTRPVYEQVLTTGYLIPVTQSMNRNALFAIFDQQYDMKVNLQANLKTLADAIRANVVFVSKVSPIALEFDSRGLFDENYIRKNDLIIPKFCGLCDKVLTRFDTIKKLNTSRASVPYYFKYFNNFAQTLVIESLVSNLFRIVGIPAQQRKQTNVSEYFVDNSAILFLLEGQSSRADKYNQMIEEQIFIRGQSDLVQSIVNTTDADKSSREQMMSNILRGNFITLMHQYAHTDKVFGPNKIDDLFGMLILAYKTIGDTGKQILFPAFSFFSPQLFKIAVVINNKLDEHSEEIKTTINDDNFAKREHIFDIVIDEATAEDVFLLSETENIQLLIARAKSELI